MYTLISILTILFSFPSIFIIPAIIFAKSIEEKKFNKKSLIILSGIIICCLYLYFIDMKTYQFMNNYWQTVEYGFINPSFNSIKSIIIQAIIYTYTGTNLLWIQLTLCCLGFINFFKQKKQYRYLILFIILFSLVAGTLKIYPVGRRHIIYLIPIIIIYTVAIIDTQWEIIKNTFLKNLINMLIAILIVFTMEIKITNIFPFNLDTYYYEMDTIDTRYEMDQNLYKLIDESKENDFFLIPNEITIMMYFYNVMYNFNKFLNTISFPYETIDVQEVEDFTLEKIQIKPKDITLYIVSVKKSNSIIPDETFIEDILKKQNYKYEKQSDDCMYIFKVYNKT